MSTAVETVALEDLVGDRERLCAIREDYHLPPVCDRPAAFNVLFRNSRGQLEYGPVCAEHTARLRVESTVLEVHPL